MSTIGGFIGVLAFFCAAGDGPKTASKDDSVVLFNGVATPVSTSKPAGKDLWLTLADLTRATKLELKPEGVCTERACTPLPEAKKKDLVAEESGTTRFNLSGFAHFVKQPVAHDAKHRVWFFGPRPDEQNSYVASLIAPDFTLPDLSGKSHSLSDFRGKKVLLITWGSW
jgi:hypothetical protein